MVSYHVSARETFPYLMCRANWSDGYSRIPVYGHKTQSWGWYASILFSCLGLEYPSEVGISPWFFQPLKGTVVLEPLATWTSSWTTWCCLDRSACSPLCISMATFSYSTGYGRAVTGTRQLAAECLWLMAQLLPSCAVTKFSPKNGF